MILLNWVGDPRGIRGIEPYKGESVGVRVRVQWTSG